MNGIIALGVMTAIIPIRLIGFAIAIIVTGVI